MLPPNSLALQSPTPPIHQEIAINISKWPQIPKKRKKLTDAPNTDDPDAVDDAADDAPNATYNDAGSTESKKPQYSLRKRSQYFKNAHNTKQHKNITGAPDSDAKIAAGDDAVDAPNTADNDAISTDSKNPYIH